MIKSLGPGLDTTDFIRIALGSQHTFIVVQNSNLSKPLVITWPQLLRQIQDQLNIISGGSTIEVQDEGVIIDTTAQFLNFIGAGVNVTQNGNGVDVTIPGGGGGSSVWGFITGTITNQTDLVTYVAAQIAAALLNYVPNSRTITINGLTQDLSANRTWTISIPTYTANNGVQPESGNPTNFELGGSIIKSTFIDVGPSNSGHDLQFDSNGPLGGSGKIKFTATTGTYSPTDKLVRFEASGAISAYVIADGTNGTGIFIQSTSSGAIPMIISNSSSAEILRMLNSGQLQLNLYNSATAFQGSSGSSVGVLNVDNTGKLFVGAGGGGGGVTSVGATAPITSSGGTTPTISTSMATNKLIGRGTAGVGVMEEITLGANLSLSGTTLNATGGGDSISPFLLMGG
jgi:hypothetical protein